MSATRSDDVDLVRHGIALGCLLGIGVVLTILLGIDVFTFLMVGVNVAEFAALLAVVYLLFRLVIAVEGIERKL